MNKPIDLKGKTYGRLTVIEYAGRKNKKTQWKCRCSCGNILVVATNNLRNGHTQSCGCYAKEVATKNATKHNQVGTQLYRAWANMITRATNPKFIEADRYVNRGITVCPEWLEDSSIFIEWALKNGYQKGLSLDRIDNSKGYYPDNCRWANKKQQCRNKDNNVWIDYKGMRKTLIEWSEYLGISYKKLHSRIRKHNWDIKRAFTTP